MRVGKRAQRLAFSRSVERRQVHHYHSKSHRGRDERGCSR